MSLLEPMPDSHLKDELDELATQCRTLWSAWEAVALGLGHPTATSPAATDAEKFTTLHPDADRAIGWLAGMLGSRFVAAMGVHVVTLAALIDQRELRLSHWSVIRAELELAGRASWLIGPSKDRSWPDSETRAARAMMEILADARRHLRTAKAQKHATGRETHKLAENKIKKDLDIVFPGWTLEDVPENPEKPHWELNREKHVGLSAGVKLFADLTLDMLDGLYDVFSTLAHPSWISLQMLSTDHEDEGITHSVFVLRLEQLDQLVQMACVSFYKAAHLVVDYFDLKDGPLEAWADDAPDHWFTS